MTDVSNIAILPVGESVHPDGMLEAARNQHLKRVFIVGWREDGSFFYSSSESIEKTIYMLRNAEHEMFKSMDRTESIA